MSAVLRSLDLRPGDALLTTDHAYGACRNALDFIAKKSGAEVIAAKIPLPVRGPEDVVERILEAATGRVKLALVDHVTSPTGLVLPIVDIVRGLRARGIETLVDGAHAPGMVDLDVTGVGAAYYVGNFHKWVCSPKGAAMLCVREDRQAGVHPGAISHGYTSTRARSRFLEEFDWTGSDDPSAWLSVPAAIRFIGGLVPGGWPEVRRRNRELALEARRLLSDALGVPVLAPESSIGSLRRCRFRTARKARPLGPTRSCFTAGSSTRIASKCPCSVGPRRRSGCSESPRTSTTRTRNTSPSRAHFEQSSGSPRESQRRWFWNHLRPRSRRGASAAAPSRAACVRVQARFTRLAPRCVAKCASMAFASTDVHV